MDRSATASFLYELALQRNAPLHLVEVYLDTGTLRMCDGYRPVVWNGNTYFALGHVLGFEGVQETSELKNSEVTVSLSGMDPRLEAPESGTLMAAMISQDYIDRRVVIYKAFVNTAQQLVIDPVAIFDGRIDQPSITDDPVSGTCSISLSAASQWVDFERRPGRHTNHEEQQLHAPGDKGFEFVSEINRQIKWGAV